MERRDFLRLTSGALIGTLMGSSGLINPAEAMASRPPIKLSTEEETNKFTKEAKGYGNVIDILGFRTSKAFEFHDPNILRISHQCAILERRDGQKTVPAKVLDELSRGGYDRRLASGELGVTIPRIRRGGRIPPVKEPRLIEHLNNLGKMGFGVDNITAYGDYKAYEVYRLPEIAIQYWKDEKRIQHLLVGDAIRNGRFLPDEVYLPVPQMDKDKDPLSGCQLTNSIWEGTASYYTRAGCIGCNSERRMSNGERLDDNRRTLAFMRTRLNETVLVENLANGLSTAAVVTDRGGFEARNWIADLSWATRVAIGGEDLTRVRITLLDCG